MIDVLSRFMVVVPIKGKDEANVASGMIEGFNKMGGKPKILYTDDEGAFQKEAIKKYLDEEGIQHHKTRAHANFSERAVRTFKDMLYKRVEADEKKVKRIFNGQTIFLKYCLHIIIKWNTQLLK